MLPEGRKTQGILPTHSVRGNISVSGLKALSRAGFVDREAERRVADDLARSLSIRMADIRQPITSLSGGNQQKALFARALLARPKVLLLDEPTHGVDVGAKAEIYEIIRRLAAEGAAVVAASSELPEILAIADRCVVFAGGRVVADLGRDTMTEADDPRPRLRASRRRPPRRCLPMVELYGRTLSRRDVAERCRGRSPSSPACG